MQIPSVDFTEKISPVATDTSIRIVIVLILFLDDSHGWRARGLEVEAAFLEGHLQKKYYLELPNMLGMYGQVDAALRFFRRFVGDW